MRAETDLKSLLATMRPELHECAYVICSVNGDISDGLLFKALGIFREREGTTIIAQEQQAKDHQLSFDTTWACITLTVHSSLTAVGFLAAVTTRLARAGISVNPVSAYYHDHLFVPWESRRQAMAALEELSASHQ